MADGTQFATLDELVEHFRATPIAPHDPFLLTCVLRELTPASNRLAGMLCRMRRRSCDGALGG